MREQIKISQLDIGPQETSQQRKGKKRLASRKAKETSKELEYTSDMQFEMAPLARVFKNGTPLVDDPSKYGVECQQLHDIYMQITSKDVDAGCIGLTDANIFQHDMHRQFYVYWSDVFDLFNDRELDVAIMRVFAMYVLFEKFTLHSPYDDSIDLNLSCQFHRHMLRQQGLGRVPNNVVILDPYMCTHDIVKDADLVVQEYLGDSLTMHTEKNSMLAPINVG